VNRPQPFRIAIDQAALDDLAARLAHPRWPPTFGGCWTDGIDDAHCRALVEAWRALDWRAVEEDLNAFPQFQIDVDGEAIHFVHLKGKGPAPKPLILSHGWPSSFSEWLRIGPMLADPGAHGGDPADAFDVIIPSLPGTGFSDIPRAAGTSPRVVAGKWVKRMAALGHDRFFAHGCDWGSYVTSLLGLQHPEHAVAIHTGMVSLAAPRDGSEGEPSPHDRAYAKARKRWQEEELGYIGIQGTRPQTLAYALTDSAVGLAAWIGEKWHRWVDPETPIDRRAVLTNIAIYWFTGTINSANRYYFESRRDPVSLAPGQKVEVPSGFFLERASGERGQSVAGLPDRAGAPSRERAARAFNVQRWFEAPRGGHFPALEVPDLLGLELRDFFRPYRDRL